MVGADGALPLPWIEPALAQIVRAAPAHAWLLHGPPGVGQFELAVTLAQRWLCESTQPLTTPCGICASCRLVQSHSHPDLLVLVPEALQESLGWAAADGDSDSPARTSKAKPSKEIKVDAVREAVAFAQVTSARGRAKVIVVHPAQRMNAVSANTLLKTLEEPPGQARFVLSAGAIDALLPTVRSRCQSVALTLPPVSMAIDWLLGHGVSDAATMLGATGGQPQLALEWSREGVDATSWTRLPAAVRQGQSSALAAWPLPRVVDALQKLCHDAACMAAGASPRYFPRDVVPVGCDVQALVGWMAELRRVAEHAEHPWSAGLLIDSLVQQGQRALQPVARKPAS